MLLKKLNAYKANIKKTVKPLSIGLCASLIPVLAQAQDILANTTIKQDVQDTFGTGSTFFFLMLFVEIILVCILFMTKKHPMVFISVIILMIVPPVLVTLAGTF